MTDPILTASGLKTYFPAGGSLSGRRGQFVRAVDGVDLEISPGETLGLVGESGCGKSSLARTMLRLVDPTEGMSRSMDRAGRARRPPAETAPPRPADDLPGSGGVAQPRLKVGEIIAEGLAVHKIVPRSSAPGDLRGARAGRPDRGRDQSLSARILRRAATADRHRRGPVLKPRPVIADEPVGAGRVDPVPGADLLVDLRTEFGLTYVFVAHNLAVVGYISDRIAVSISSGGRIGHV